MDQTFCRILLDLTELNFKEFKYVWMSLSDRELRTIGDLKNAVIRKFGFERTDIKFYVHDGLLLQDEKIVVLRENDIVRIRYEDFADPVHYASNVSTSSIGLPEQNENSREFNVTSDTSACSLRKQKRKRSVVLNDSVEENSDQVGFKKKKKRKKSHKTSTPEIASSFDTHIIGECATFEPDPENELISEEISTETTVEKSKRFHNAPKFTSLSSPMNEGTSLSFTENTIDVSSVVSPNGTEQSGNLNGVFNINEAAYKKVESVVLTDQPDILNGDENTSALQGNNCKKKKRKRHKKRKVPLNIAGSFEPGHSDVSSFLPVQNQSNMVDYSCIRKHIRFGSPVSKVYCVEESGENVGSIGSPDESPTVPLQSTVTRKNFNLFTTSPIKKVSLTESVKSNYFEPKSNDSVYLLPKENHLNTNEYSHPQKHVRFGSPVSKRNQVDLDGHIVTNETNKTQEDSTALPPKSKATRNNIALSSSPIEENDVVSNKSMKKSSACFSSEMTTSSRPLSDYLKFDHLFAPSSNKKTSQFLEHKKSEDQKCKDYSSCAVLNALPTVGTCIAFKMLELDHNYSPVVSNYKEGKIISCPSPDQVEIELSKKEVKAGRVGKFENLKEDELPQNEVVENVVTSWSALVEPRLISYS